MAIVDVRCPGQTPIMNAAAASADQTSDVVEMNNACTHASFQVITASFNTTDATVKLQVSNDNSNWTYKSDANGDDVVLTIASGAENSVISLNGVVTEQYYRAVFAHGTNSAGTVTIKVRGKVPL